MARLVQMLNGHIMTQLVATAVRLGIPDQLAEGPLTEAELARRIGIEPVMLLRLLPALREVDLVEWRGGRCLATPMSALLRKDGGPMYGQALLAGGDYYEAWQDLGHSLRTGQSAFEHRHGVDLWRRFEGADNATAAAFARTMRFGARRFTAELAGLVDLEQVAVVADIGAGGGTLLAGLLAEATGLRGIAFEQPTVIDHVRETLDEHGVSDRCQFVAGDFLDEIPVSADLYLLKAVLHNWNDDNAIRILRNIRDAMPDDQSRLLVIERPGGAGLNDLTMLVLFGSQDRSVNAYRDLVERAGLTVDRMMTTESGMCVLETRR